MTAGQNTEIADFITRSDREEIDETDFAVLRRGHECVKPGLVVIVHPGDIVEPFESEHSMNAQADLAAEIASWREAGHQFAILHRCSCAQFFDLQYARRVDQDLAHALDELSLTETVLYGDDLDLAVDWLATNMAPQDRTMIIMAGAYALAKHGCVTFVGKGLEAIAPGRVSLAPSAYTPHPDDERWLPMPYLPEDPGSGHEELTP